jgi:hypothetical protein
MFSLVLALAMSTTNGPSQPQERADAEQLLGGKVAVLMFGQKEPIIKSAMVVWTALDPDLSTIQTLRKQRFDAAVSEFEARLQAAQKGEVAIDLLIASSNRVLSSQRDLSVRKQDQIAALEAHLFRVRNIEQRARSLYENARLPIQDYSQAKYSRLDAEISLKVAKGR